MHFGLIVAIVVAVFVWGRIMGTLRRKPGDAPPAANDPSPQPSPWDRPAPAILRRALDVESLGVAPTIRAIRSRAIASRSDMPDTSFSPSNASSSPTEVHMNPISALIFVIFIGGGVLAFLAHLIPLAIILALIGIFMGY